MTPNEKPASPTQGAVKDLEWTGRNADGTIHKAYFPPMEYWVWELAGYGYWSWGSLSGREVHGGLEAAKAAAQSDFEARILSALDRTTLPPAEGMVLVPREPTEFMIDNAEEAMEERRNFGLRIYACDVWESMIAAAPQGSLP